MFSYYSIYTRKMLEHCNGGASMKEKERGKNETEKKGVKKRFQCGNRTRDLLICSRHIATASGICCTYNNITDIYRKSQWR